MGVMIQGDSSSVRNISETQFRDLKSAIDLQHVGIVQQVEQEKNDSV